MQELFNLIKERADQSVINNPDVPNEQNEAVLSDANTSVTEGLQKMLASGGFENVMSMFGGNASATQGPGGLLNNPIVSNIVNNFKERLTRDRGLADDKANNLANDLIPNVISGLVQKTNDPNDSSFDLKNIITSFTGQEGGGGGLDLNNMLNKFTGGKMDSDGDGKIELNDILSKFGSGNR